MIEQLFSIPLLNVKVKNFNKIQNEITQGLKNSKFDKPEPVNGKTHYLSDSSFTENWLDIHNCNTLLSEIKTYVKEFAPAMNMDKEYKIKNSWVALFRKYNYGYQHNHGQGLGISGIYYYKVKGSTGNVFFKSTRCWQGTVSGDSEEGRLYLFPSDFEHGVTQNITDVSRISISFNLT